MTGELAETTLHVSYAQIAVFASTLNSPFNDWTDKHVAQGFAWRPHSVSFRTLGESGPHFIRAALGEHFDPTSPSVVRAMRVPFEVPDDHGVDIASISDAARVMLSTGKYALQCELMRGRDAFWEARLIFATKEPREFRVVVADAALTVEEPLLTTARPALG